MSIRRKRSDLALGPSRALGVRGVRVVGSWGTWSVSAGTDPAVMYSSVQSGDLILALSAVSTSGLTTWGLSCPGLTFSTVHDAAPGGSRFLIGRAFAPDSTNRTVTLVSDGAPSALAVLALRGVDPASPIDASPLDTTHQAATQLTVPSITTETPNALALLALWTVDDNTPTAPNPWSPANADVVNVGTNNSFGVWSRPVAAAGAIGTTVVTENTSGPDAARSAIFAVRALAG